jgi:hypothetical protein
MFHLCCNLTNIEFYECNTPNLTDPLTGKINIDIKGKEQDVVIGRLSRYIEFSSKGYNSQSQSQNYGRQEAQSLRLFLEKDDIRLIRTGTKARFNFTTMYEDAPYNSELKPFIYNISQRDIIDCEVHEIKWFGGLNAHYEATLITYY